MKRRPAGPASADLETSVDQDGVVRVELRRGARDRRLALVGLVAAVLFVGASLWIWGCPGTPEGTQRRPRDAGAQKARAAASGRSRSPEAAAPGTAARPARAPAALPPLEPAEATIEAEAPVAPAPEGIAAFPAPGTKRIKAGLVVPDDFPLPEGYVRHYQATDNGRMLQAILMFHPDHAPLDAQGNPVPLPSDRVVPPEMAPPGLPLERLEIPEDAYADPHEDAMSAEEGSAGPPEDSAEPAP
ncbi:hypothetical protein [Sorangium sp. So ce1389]|uniref:hypothetical protein n=1 Tax=Sorangium sp. So ce1389 TaxID=3133336 RepID=UPI003F5F018B